MRQFLLLFCTLFPLIGLAQSTQTIKGTVLDAESRQPLIGASVFVEVPVAGLMGAGNGIE